MAKAWTGCVPRGWSGCCSPLSRYTLSGLRRSGWPMSIFPARAEPGVFRAWSLRPYREKGIEGRPLKLCGQEGEAALGWSFRAVAACLPVPADPSQRRAYIACGSSSMAISS